MRPEHFNEPGINLDLVRAEWPAADVDGIYLNSGSCGVKPKSVLSAIESGWQRLNRNPTLMTFIDKDVWEDSWNLAAELLSVPASEIMIIPNSTFGIQMVMQSLLLQAGDELLTTDQEHSCVKTMCRFLEERRGVVVRRHKVEPFAGSEAFCQGLMQLVSSKTRLVLVSEINCLSGWRPNLDTLVTELASRSIPLLLDGAHVPGQGPINIERIPFWVASAHKWMGAPNGSGFLRVHPEYIDQLQPLIIGDRYYADDHSSLHRFEWPGTCDVVRLLGLQAAIRLQLNLGPENIVARQRDLHKYLRDSLSGLGVGSFRTPWVEGENSALCSIYWNKKELKVTDLREELWQKHKIWTQPDFALAEPGLGMRISCNIFNTESEIDSLVAALKSMLN